MKKIILSAVMIAGFASLSFTSTASTPKFELNSTSVNYVDAYVVKKTNGSLLYFQQLVCAENYINSFGGTLDGMARVKETQAFSCAFED
ncbi:hypothetical protein ACTS9C_05250 [Empedobacter brevis]